MTIKTEAVIIGAGPSGLFQVFELGLLGISAHIVDSLPTAGGQCTALYPDKPIYDIPALPVCGAQELVDRLQAQIVPFAPTFHLHQEVVELEANPEHGFYLKTSKGTEFLTRTVVIAGGLGSFQPRPLRLPGIEQYANVNLHYKITDRERFRDKRLVILGGGDSALDWTLDLHGIASHITLVHRRDEFRGVPASVSRVRKLAGSLGSNVDIRIANVKGFEESPEGVSGIVLETSTGPSSVELEELMVFYGLSPNLRPIANWGLGVERRQIAVNTENFETNIPGIFAVGDINTYPGKKKLILSGFHEAALAAFGIQKILYPERKQYVQYTTTSTVMHERLGLSQRLVS